MSGYIRGAEASIHEATYLGRDVIIKTRVPKTYRHPVLDARLRNERTRDEASLLLAARRAGVQVPVLYDVDRENGDITLEPIRGKALRDQLLHDDDQTAALRFHHLGEEVAKLHDAGLTHGDLTTSNILVPEPRDPTSAVFIDFGLGQFTQQEEDQAVDVHLLEEALEATDARVTDLMAAFLKGYHPAKRNGILRRFEAMKERGRYRGSA
ncbi:MAG: KEOPS complex kinase/ATPase Bud32 [Thermoplasmatota archaeon]